MTLELKAKIDRNNLRSLFFMIKGETSKCYLSFGYDILKLRFFNIDKTTLHNIEIKYDSYSNFLNKNDKDILIELDTFDFFEEINDKRKYQNKYIVLSIINGQDIMKIESTDL